MHSTLLTSSKCVLTMFCTHMCYVLKASYLPIHVLFFCNLHTCMLSYFVYCFGILLILSYCICTLTLLLTHACHLCTRFRTYFRSCHILTTSANTKRVGKMRSHNHKVVPSLNKLRSSRTKNSKSIPFHFSLNINIHIYYVIINVNVKYY